MLSWVEERVLDKKRYENRRLKYGKFVYFFQFSLINASYDSVSSMILGYCIPLVLAVSLIGYHTACYVLTVTTGYRIGRMDIVLASVHSIILAVFVAAALGTYFVYGKGIVGIEDMFKERLYLYKHILPPPAPTFFEQVVNFFIKNGVVLGLLSLFTGVYVISPLMDLRFWQTDCLKENINFCIALPMYHPYQSDEGWRFYLSVGVQTFFGIYRICIFFSVQITMTLWSQHVVEELSLLRESLKNFDLRTEMEFFMRTGRKIGDCGGLPHKNKEFAECAKFCLHENVKHHQNILMYFNKTNALLAFPSFLAYMAGTLTMGIAMVKILTIEGDSTIGVQFQYVIVLSSEILFMVMISIVGEYITGMGEDIFTDVSHLNLHKRDTGFRRDLLIFMSGTINPIALSSSKFNKCNHEALGNVFNAAYSFYNVTKASSIK